MNSTQSPNNEDLRYYLALTQAPKIGPGIFKAIVAYAGSASYFFKHPKGKVAKIPKVGPKLLAIRNQESELLKKADALIATCEKNGYTLLTSLHEDFPQRFKQQEDSPTLIFARGKSNLNFDRSIGIVGTRSATNYGKSTTRKIIEDLAIYQPAIISGLAYGIDIEAHRTALQTGLSTIAVMGSPISQIYPAVHKNTAEAIMENGCVISEYPPEGKMNPGNFPARNRIIASLSDALIVVEAAEKGGALITAEIAYSYDKDVFAVPGNLQSQYSEGCNFLIRKLKANIYTGPSDVADALHWNKPGDISSKKTPLDLSGRNEAECRILNLLMENGELEIDYLSMATDIPLGSLASILLSMEFEGILKSLPGKKYKLLL